MTSCLDVGRLCWDICRSLIVAMYPDSWLWALWLLLVGTVAAQNAAAVAVAVTSADVASCPERCVCPKRRVGDKFTKVKCGGLDKPIMYLSEIPLVQLSNFTGVTFL